MIDLLGLIILCVIFAYIVQSRTCCYSSVREGVTVDIQSRVVCVCVLIAFILFAGLRSKYNDTSNYMQAFELIDTTDLNVSILLEPYGGFDMYQKLIKKYISENPQFLIFITAIITNVLYFRFYIRHTNKFCEMIFLYAIGNYVFSMAGLKQAVAVAISLYAIENYMDGKYIKMIILLFIAMTFHPYIICLICVPFLKKNIWDRKTIVVIVLCFFAFINLDKVFEIFSLIGKDYSNGVFNDYTINPIRVIIESIPIILSFYYRKRLNQSTNRMLILGINMKIISFIFIVMGLFANPIYFGRMSTYFTALSTIAIPEMLAIIWRESRNKKVYILGYYLFFFVYFLMDMTKIGTISIFTDQFYHVSFSELF